MAAASTNTLLTPLQRLHAPDLREAMRALLDGAIERTLPGWPRLLTPTTAESWLRASDVAIELSSTPAHQAFELAVILPAISATRVVDRLLGAPSETGVPSAFGAPSEVECGLLAYVAARLCAAWDGTLSLREVRRHLDGPPVVESVLWPLALATDFGSIECSLLLAPELAARIVSLPLLVGLNDELAPGTSLDDLRVGDLLVGDRWLITATTEGLCGEVRLFVPGSSTAFDGTLERGHVRARTATPANDALTIVLADRACSLLELARLTSGAALAVTVSTAVSLRRDERTIAHGELVRERGRVGMRIEAVVSPADQVATAPSRG